VLGGFAADPDQKLSDLPLVTADELATIARWNDTGVEYPLDSALHELITAQARRTPTAVAVRCGAGSLTYQELDEASNRLANLLWANGTEAGELVGVCLDRSSQALVALLGVLKAGAAYVPLDPTYPVARLEYMLADTELRTLVTSGGQTLPFETPSVTVIDTVDSAGFDTQPLNLPGDTAYVIYTSGSTGRPKGVVIEHRSAVNLFYSMQERISLTPSDVQLTVTSPSFDMAVPELLMPLVFGASVYVAPKEAAADGGKLLSLLLESRTTVLQATPTTWQLLVDAGLGRGQLRLALCTSEAMPAAVAGALHDRVPAVWNLYGPTEATVFATMRQIEEEDGHSAPPIGLPLGNTTLHVLDRYQRTTPIGAVGELYIGGAGLAREYLGRAKLTGERFVSLDGERVYRTGDLVRQRPDGTVEYCGRIDNQIKLRGFRIELGEIETVAADHPGIRRALAALVAFGRDDQRIVCYLTPAEGATPPTAEELREHASGRLPSYMVPAHFVVVDEFPLTPNGKVDRSALVRLPVGGPASVQEPPRTPLEGTLAEIWADLLGVASVGRDDDFFGLGGHSLLAIQAISRIQERCAVTLTVDVVFDKPTVARLAVVVEERQAEARDLLLSALARVEGMSESAVTAMLSELETTVQQ
jgi:amino acid adenylation domain-containing protein